MAGDYTRVTFNPLADFAGLFMQQGRVQLDADMNELVELLYRRVRAETVDIIGRCTVPKETPDGFRINVSGGQMSIGRGRIYVDGLLAENHGQNPLEFHHVLDEIVGTNATPYEAQPYLPEPPALPGGGPHLVYLDVWNREVTAVEQPERIEKAVGVDTATRWQTVWQVKVLARLAPNVTCATPDQEMPEWLDIIRPSAGRLTTAAIGQPSSEDPCIIPPNGGYRGTENHLYRVEVHDAGAQGTATFKWSRDNGSVASNVQAIDVARTYITVVHTGRDAVLRFNAGDWVEIADDHREFSGLAGIMRKVQSVDHVNHVITLTTALPAGTFPTSGPDHLTDPQRHTRIRRWDQKDRVRDAHGNVIADVDASGGVIPVPAAATPATTIVLEDGVQITFTTDPAGGRFKVGDYWVFAARTIDASVELLEEAPPRGIHHHYGRLAIVTFPDAETDCRVLWPPDMAEAGCGCTVCVTAESHNSGTLTIQRAIDQVRTTGGTICLGPGIYSLGASPLRVHGAQSVHLQGQGWKTILVYAGSLEGATEAAITVENSIGITVEELTIITPSRVVLGNRSIGGDPGVMLRNCLGMTLQRCLVLQSGSRQSGDPAIGLAGFLAGVVLRENALIASSGIGHITGREQEGRVPYLLTMGLYIQDNLLWCERRGISLGGFSLHFAETRLSGNFINGCSQGGITAVGAVVPGSDLNVQENTVRARGNGIVIGTDEARISSNDISAVGAGLGGDGIVLTSGLDSTGLDHCQVLGNRVTGVAGHGIAIRAHVQSAMLKQNMIEGVDGGGIVMEDTSSADNLSIANNQLLNIAPAANDPARAVIGIGLLHTGQAEVASNTIKGLGQNARQSAGRVGIQVLASSSVRITGNDVVDVGPAQFINASSGIEVLAPFDQVDAGDNAIRRHQGGAAIPDQSLWYALHIGEAVTVPTPTGDFFRFWIAGASFFALSSNRLIVLPRGRGMIAVRGNHLETYGGAPAVDIASDGVCTFSDNRCLLDSRTAAGAAFVGPEAATRITAGAVIASSNYIAGPRGVPPMALHLPQAQQPPLTVVGNITSGTIRVNTGVLGDPWALLNVSTL